MKTTAIILLAIILTLIGIGFLPKVAAVNPPPDGGYSGGNTAEGQSALLTLGTGTYNTAVGFFSLLSNVEGNFNTAIGAGSLLVSTADENTATGAGALLSNTIGTQNTANGTFALFSNTEGAFNAANGDQALFSNTTGNGNTADGYQALYLNVEGGGNTANGYRALYHTTGINNTSTGIVALYQNTTGSYNTADGFQALNQNTDGNYNTANGSLALQDNSSGQGNTASGYGALANSTGFSNTAFGFNAGANVTTADNVICIGADGANVGDSCYIGNIFSQTGGTQAVYVSSTGKLGQMVSSRRFKDEIKPMEQASEVIYGLKPVSFRYKPEIEPTRPLGFGLIAEEVEQISPHLVTHGRDGKVNSVRYDQVNAMLLNEFLKAHRKIEEQEAAIIQLREEIETVVARLREHDSRFERVSDRIESRKVDRQMVQNP